MTGLVACALALSNFLAQQRPVTSVAVHYNVGVFQKVANNRGIKLRTDVAGYAAVRDCGRIGQLVRARVGKAMGWFQVLDCSHPRDYSYQDGIKYGPYRGVVIEVNAAVAQQGGWFYPGMGSGKTSATVYGYRR